MAGVGRRAKGGGGLAPAPSFESLSPDPVNELEDVEMSDEEQDGMEESYSSGKRKRGSPDKARSTRAPAVSQEEPESATEQAAVRRVRKQSQRAREAEETQRELDNRMNGHNPQKAFAGSDVMSLLLEISKKMTVMENENRKRENENKKREAAYKKQIEDLECMVKTMTLDIRSLQEGSPYWGMSLESGNQSSYLSTDNRSYAAVAATGVSLQRPRSNSRGSRVSFDLSSSQGSPPQQRSPVTSPQMSMNTSLRSAIRSTVSDQGKQGVMLVMDMKELDKDILEQEDEPGKMRARLLRALRTIQGLEKLDIQDFKLWHTNNEVRVIRFRVSREEEGPVRQSAADWIHTHFKGARLIGPKWYAIKVDWIDKTLASDAETGRISEAAGQRFGQENGVEVRQMRWLGRPKEKAQHASAVVKVATKEQAERLLMARFTGKEITFGGASVEVSTFEDRRGPVACFKCQRYGHMKRNCTHEARCANCGREGHERCDSVDVRCANCGRAHRAVDRNCPVYRQQRQRILTIHAHE